MDNFTNYINELINIQKSINFEKVEILSEKVKLQLKNNKKIFIAGNGGSSYNSSHFVTDWFKFSENYSSSLVFSLSDNVGLITAYANDNSYENIFSEQIKKLMCKDDLLIVLSGSGNSKNLINAVNLTNKMGISSFGILGFDGGNLKNICSDFIHIKSFDMQFCEDIQIQIGHYIMKKINT